ncbi:MAG: LPS export ABC transporter periplasmic protein LptC [Nitrospina sp.]|jgi:LPS export ABC transporter protein LptC|nr:LPS export ABC transporter periplasmic protein LptC [Nitrospina sp.]MBT5633324.1 LPS export ABC transporter periplasmic protein LptC [Nitrospina sp.]
MINTIRRVLLLLAFCIIGAAGYYIFKNINTSVEIGNIKVKIMEKGIDVEIENFRVAHEVKGVKEWELKADFAQINNQEDLTKMQNVEMILHKAENKKYVISADSGTYKKATKDVNLMGNVKFVGSPDILMDRLNTKSPTASQKQ